VRKAVSLKVTKEIKKPLTGDREGQGI
jgi:hypothetical protein